MANALKALAKTSQKNNKTMIEEERKRREEERKQKRIGNMSSLLLKYLLIHRSYNFHIVLNLVIKETVGPLQLLTRINQ